MVCSMQRTIIVCLSVNLEIHEYGRHGCRNINQLTKVEEKEHNKRVTKPNRGSSRNRAMISINQRDRKVLESEMTGKSWTYWRWQCTRGGSKVCVYETVERNGDSYSSRKEAEVDSSHPWDKLKLQWLVFNTLKAERLVSGKAESLFLGPCVLFWVF